MQLIFVDGSKLTTADGIAIYCSRKIGRFPETSSLQQEAQLILDINETHTIRFKSIRKFDFHSNSERKERQTCIKHDKKTAVRMQSEIYNNAHIRVAGYQLTVCGRCFSRSQNGKTLAREIHIWIIPVWQIPIGKIPHK